MMAEREFHGPTIDVGKMPVPGAQQLVALAVEHGDMGYTVEGIGLANAVQVLQDALREAGHAE